MKHVQLRPVTEVRDIDPDTEKDLYEVGQKIRASFMNGLEYLIQTGHPLLEAVSKDTRAILANNYAEIGIGAVPTLTMTILGNKSEVLGLVIAPTNWLDMCAEDGPYQFGGIVFVASQVVDYYNVRPQQMIERARSLEAEYIRSLKGVELNSYQKNLLSRFPNGWDRMYEYERKPVELVN